MNPCGNRTKHTNRIGCCASCKSLFSSDSAFMAHRKRGACVQPSDAGLVPKPSRKFPDEAVWSLPRGTWRDEDIQ